MKVLGCFQISQTCLTWRLLQHVTHTLMTALYQSVPTNSHLQHWFSCPSDLWRLECCKSLPLLQLQDSGPHLETKMRKWKRGGTRVHDRDRKKEDINILSVIWKAHTERNQERNRVMEAKSRKSKRDRTNKRVRGGRREREAESREWVRTF